MNDSSLGNIVKTYRLKSGMKQNEFARAAQLSQGVLSRIESGEIKRPHVNTLQKLARALNVSLNAITSVAESKESFDVLPFIKALATSQYARVDIEDLKFLTGIQLGLKEVMTKDLIEMLMKARKTEVKTPSD